MASIMPRADRILMRWASPPLARVLAALCLAALAACEPTDDMTPEVVTSFPDGDALGSAASGEYQVTARTTSCSGPCQYLSPLYGTGHYCQQGEETVTVAITQTDGHLELRGSYLNPGMRIRMLAGGIDSGGHFEVGGERGDETPAATMRLEGAFGPGGLTATGKGRLRRPGVGECVGAYHWTGARDP